MILCGDQPVRRRTEGTQEKNYLFGSNCTSIIEQKHQNGILMDEPLPGDVEIHHLSFLVLHFRWYKESLKSEESARIEDEFLRRMTEKSIILLKYLRRTVRRLTGEQRLLRDIYTTS